MSKETTVPLNSSYAGRDGLGNPSASRIIFLGSCSSPRLFYGSLLKNVKLLWQLPLETSKLRYSGFSSCEISLTLEPGLEVRDLDLLSQSRVSTVRCGACLLTL